MTGKKNQEKKRAKLTDQELVQNYMDNLTHSLKPEIETLREVIKKSDNRICERIKWNAPSYYHIEDIVTFGPMRKDKQILLVFHHPFVNKIKSELLKGDYKDRRLVAFSSMSEIKDSRKELTRIMKEMVAAIDSGELGVTNI